MNKLMFVLLALAVSSLPGCANGTGQPGGVQHYDQGYVAFVDRPDPPNRKYEVRGKMDVTPGEQMIRVSTEDGVYLIPRERLIFVGPDPEAIKEATKGSDALDTTRAFLEAFVDATRDHPIPATLFYTGSSRAYDYYYVARRGGGGEVYRIDRKKNTQKGRMPVTQDRDRWQRLKH